ncbi:alpha/beta hydrolase domain-containing protein [Clostridium sp. YIM B02506]|uniref:alpha/beta hydrolase domain-containing protein n=1 Tax=Clostridium sp. YIM B02506 TaxID=2910680 RepID=UPI001EEE5135|nr:alpha/beta hydrolase domain-containing protein [Clostridium sp. YIM B02506]
MIEKIKLIPVTENSVPFAQAAKKCDFDKIGYIEEEFFMWGTSNIYENGEDYEPITIYENAPYVNRFIVRRPMDVSKFSGNVVIEILNPTALIDLDRMWVNSWKYFTRNGDIYIGITSKSDVLNSLYSVDNERYSVLSWENPMPERAEPKNSIFKFFPQYEAGLFWDMLTDFAKALRTKSELNPISQYGDYKLYLTGWSQSAGYLVRYVKSFAYLKENCSELPMFDGYLAAGGGASPAPLNSYEPIKVSSKGYFYSEGAGVMGAREPYIAINTESENEAVKWKGDSDIPGKLFRAYEVPGSSHDNVNNTLKWLGADENYMMGKRRLYSGVEGDPNDYPCEFVFNAAFRNLYCWVRYGVPAPHAESIKIGYDGKNITDVFGNAIGGIRTPFIDLPTASYHGFSTKPDGSERVFGYKKNFTKEKLKAIYSDLENYKTLAEKSTDSAIASGFIIPEEREEVIKLAVERAKSAGLS